MVGLRDIKNFAQSTMEHTKPLKNMASGAFQIVGMAAAYKTGLIEAGSDLIASPINKAKSLFKKPPAPKTKTIMERALSTIKKPSVIAGAALTAGGLYALGRMTSTPETSHNTPKDENTNQEI